MTIILIGLATLAGQDYVDGKSSQLDELIQPLLSGEPDRFKANGTAAFPYVRNNRTKEEEDPLERYQGVGRLYDCFPDLTRRRHPFATLSFTLDRAEFVLYRTLYQRDGIGSIYQGYVANRLLRRESTICDRRLPLENRVQAVIEAAPDQSLVRDIHIELVLTDAIEYARELTDILRAGNLLLPLFSNDSKPKAPLAQRVFRAVLQANPDLHQDVDAYVAMLPRYIPNPSIARNYFLGEFENLATLTVAEFRRMMRQRYSYLTGSGRGVDQSGLRASAGY